MNKNTSNNKTDDKMPSTKEKVTGKTFQSILDGSVLARDYAVKSLPFVLFIALLTILYIANNYYAEKKTIELGRIKRDLKELRYEHISTKSQLMFQSKQSQVAEKLKLSGIKESLVPPQKIINRKNN